MVNSWWQDRGRTRGEVKRDPIKIRFSRRVCVRARVRAPFVFPAYILHRISPLPPIIFSKTVHAFYITPIRG